MSRPEYYLKRLEKKYKDTRIFYDLIALSFNISAYYDYITSFNIKKYYINNINDNEKKFYFICG